MDKMRFHYNTGSQFYRIMETAHGFTPQYRHYVGGNWYNLQVDGSYVECLVSLDQAIQAIWMYA